MTLQALSKLKFGTIQWEKPAPFACIEMSFVHGYKQIVTEVNQTGFGFKRSCLLDRISCPKQSDEELRKTIKNVQNGTFGYERKEFVTAVPVACNSPPALDSGVVCVVLCGTPCYKIPFFWEFCNKLNKVVYSLYLGVGGLWVVISYFNN